MSRHRRQQKKRSRRGLQRRYMTNSTTMNVLDYLRQFVPKYVDTPIAPSVLASLLPLG